MLQVCGIYFKTQLSITNILEVKEIIRVEELAESTQTIDLDESVLLEGDGNFIEAAKKAYVEYSSLIQVCICIFLIDFILQLSLEFMRRLRYPKRRTTLFW